MSSAGKRWGWRWAIVLALFGCRAAPHNRSLSASPPAPSAVMVERIESGATARTRRVSTTAPGHPEPVADGRRYSLQLADFAPARRSALAELLERLESQEPPPAFEPFSLEGWTPVGRGISMSIEMVRPAEELAADTSLDGLGLPIHEPALWSLSWAFDVTPTAALVGCIAATRQLDESMTESLFDPDYAWFGLGLLLRL